MKPYNLLIVDDEKRFADMLAKRLTLRGCQCEVCYNGQQALDLVEQKDFFLILLDLHLPDIYGTDVLMRIKKMDSKTPVIIVTAHGTEKDRKKCIQQGAHAFVHKPLGIDELMEILARIEEMRS
ncbi:MAG: response regulator [Deltaproteobacteria bacterium]|jgi:DNA-binding response OmpR family regulator|nr:response regulator [Deltaproteobacteria bacterium]MBW2487738.1 response regulator [Deltaproteobacteria bacterium]